MDKMDKIEESGKIGKNFFFINGFENRSIEAP